MHGLMRASSELTLAYRNRSMRGWRNDAISSLLGCMFLVMSCGGQVDTSASSSSCTPDASVPFGALDACSFDADCTMCPVPMAPTSSCQCDNIAVSCCGGFLLVPLTQQRCDTNQAAWNLFCPVRPNCYPPPPCAPPPTCTAACVNGVCSGSCGFP
jgi:hypothetical protein